MNKYSLLLLLFLVTPAAFANDISGQGSNAPSVIKGDTSLPPAVPSGSSSDASSSIFPVSPEKLPMIINLRTDTYSHNTRQYMGKRVVLTLKTGMLNSMQIDLIEGILQLNTSSISGQNNISVDVNQDQLEQIQKVLVPTHGQSTLQKSWLFHYLPVVRRWSGWAVGLGVVFATVMLAVAAYGMVMSHRGSADKIVSTMAGLAVLLMAYTIYSLLVTNASNHRTVDQIGLLH